MGTFKRTFQYYFNIYIGSTPKEVVD